jgi:hypothetical protein
MCTEFINGGIATIISGFGGATLGAYCTYKASKKFIKVTYDNTIDIMRRQEFNKAAADFRVAFLPELIYLKHNAMIKDSASTNDLNVFLSSAYINRHLIAFEIFKSYLSTEDRIGIDEAWKEYCHFDIEGETDAYFAMYAEDTIDKKNTKVLALARIEKILKFAAPK